MISRRRLCALALASPFALAPGRAPLAAETEAQLMRAALRAERSGLDPGFYLTVDWEFDLPPILLESLRRGIALYFLYEFRVDKSRWYWANKSLVRASLLQRVSYSPLARQYRLSRGGLSQSFEAAEDVLALIKHVGEWRVADLGEISGSGLVARTRMRLDISRLPKPLQVSVGGNSDWVIEGDWDDVPLIPALTRR